MIGRLLLVATIGGVAYVAGKRRGQVTPPPRRDDDRRPPATQMAESLLTLCRQSRPLAEALVRAGADGSIDLDEYPGLARQVARLLR